MVGCASMRQLSMPFADRATHKWDLTSSSIFNAAKQQRLPVWQLNGCRVENAVDRIGPVVLSQYRVAFIAIEEGKSRM